ncbi:cytochrome c biogenesis protein [Kineosphaera limosa]|uniref:Cytochrome c biogenesis protein ResB n=1 Tax=Kineosphaera limosa NBRC 100340 TaxID=1184609 RepID=K6WB60_9MICO|nr:cytochrome c biogenesis protein ResB [Kineosphaera limosa]NYE01737.1 cytochrome c biogenesis protein [Kineosphaera limosa]GAB96465.1 cytochrome c biogenesis protein ResB [Kineosphaera limosa NBRC 100340]
MATPPRDPAGPADRVDPLAQGDPGGVALRREPPVPASVRQPKLGPLGWARWAWRQLTSMRTALLLLLLVAVAAVPGSVFPQRDIDPGAVSTYLEDNPTWGPWADRLYLFDVFTSPWFSAIYLLLVVSLLGCIVPRTRLHLRALRGQPPKAPSRLDRLSQHRSFEVAAPPEQVVQAARSALRSSRYRLRREDGDADGAAASGAGKGTAVAGETGYLRETGNLIFHIGVVVVVIALAWGYLVGWKADRIVPVGGTLTNTVSGYDSFSAGPLVDTDALDPFSVRIDTLDVRFEEDAGGAQYGAARDFRAATTVTTAPGAPPEQRELAVNAPLNFGPNAVFLMGNGYAPVITVRDAAGEVLYRQATPFLPQDGVYTSSGAVKVVAAQPQQLGFSGLFLPTAFMTPDGPASAFPDARNPALVLSAWTGDLMPSGPQSVYTLETSAMSQVNGADGRPLQVVLGLGQTVQLPDGLGSITFESLDRWAGLSTRYDPARPLALGSGLACLVGLLGSLMVRRRRMFVRVRPGVDGGSRVEIGALARGEDNTLGDAVDQLAERLGWLPPGSEPGSPPGSSPGSPVQAHSAPGPAPAHEAR